MRYSSNDEFFAELRHLIDGWCERRLLRPLSRILGPYLGFNGLTDGWADLSKALKSIRAMDGDELAPQEKLAIDDLVKSVDDAIYRR